jgi:hypothetical protein
MGYHERAIPGFYTLAVPYANLSYLPHSYIPLSAVPQERALYKGTAGDIDHSVACFRWKEEGIGRRDRKRG